MGGKTTIANFLSDATDNSGNEYRATQGVRIVEFESYLNINNRSLKVDIELWDCGGNKKFEKCWPACYKDANGVIFVYDPVSEVQISELDYYYDHFVLQSGIQQSNCIVVSYSRQPTSKSSAQLGNQFSRMTKITANIEEDGNKLRTHFNNYISGIINRVHDTTEREELKIINIPFGP
ncbi:intraflagellar transport protein 22 homolog isoform X2 [Nilaparvata lugens]|uniref:intraflagellar transport protein 22 homolog isoform X2 n=1 Tax=Nilaparvata lugens TaxID=108931 RepID=UPI00193E6B4E|nr:intraflagellar transport protein 22 homolog isoform X2 [Nilaparvata lugens]